MLLSLRLLPELLRREAEGAVLETDGAEARLRRDDSARRAGGADRCLLDPRFVWRLLDSMAELRRLRSTLLLAAFERLVTWLLRRCGANCLCWRAREALEFSWRLDLLVLVLDWLRENAWALLASLRWRFSAFIRLVVL